MKSPLPIIATCLLAVCLCACQAPPPEPELPVLDSETAQAEPTTTEPPAPMPELELEQEPVPEAEPTAAEQPEPLIGGLKFALRLALNHGGADTSSCAWQDVDGDGGYELVIHFDQYGQPVYQVWSRVNEKEALLLEEGTQQTELNGGRSIDEMLRELCGLPQQPVQGLEEAISSAIIAKNAGGFWPGDIQEETHATLKLVEDTKSITAYTLVSYAEYDIRAEAKMEVSGSWAPVALTFAKEEEGGYTLTEYWMPQDGTRYEPSIREKFPADIVERALEHPASI